MSGIKMYLIDTNIIIYHLENDKKATDFLLAHQGQMCISTMTVAEVLSYPYDDDELYRIEHFLANAFKWFSVTDEVIFKTAELRRIKKTKTPDAIIGATTLLHGCILVSRNQKDFQHLPITLVNPMD